MALTPLRGGGSGGWRCHHDGGGRRLRLLRLDLRRDSVQIPTTRRRQAAASATHKQNEVSFNRKTKLAENPPSAASINVPSFDQTLTVASWFSVQPRCSESDQRLESTTRTRNAGEYLHRTRRNAFGSRPSAARTEPRAATSEKGSSNISRLGHVSDPTRKVQSRPVTLEVQKNCQQRLYCSAQCCHPTKRN